MPFNLDIVPHVPTLDMYGSARPNTAYSLSGEVVLTVSSSPAVSSLSLFPSTSTQRRSEYRPTTIYISSLLLTFEGKAELISQNCGYAAHRLCSVEKELVVGGQPIILTNSGIGRRRGSASSLQNGEAQQDPAGTMRWSMTFDMAIPGWLPPTLPLEDGSGASYSIHARAKYHDDHESALAAILKTEQASLDSSLLSSYIPASIIPSQITSLFNRSKAKSTTASPVVIKVNRYRNPKSLNPFGGAGGFDLTAPLVSPQIPHPTPSLFPVTLETVETRVAVNSKVDEASRIPMEILSGIEVVAGIPEYVARSEDKIPFSLRIRSINRSAINKGLVLEAFDCEVEQTEKFRTIPCERYLSNFPVPPASAQPPNKPFLMPHPLENFYTLGLAASEAVQWTRTLPMVPQHKVNFRPAPVSGGLELDSDWAKMDMGVSVLRAGDEELPSSKTEDEVDDEKVGRALRRKFINVDYDTPLCKIRHELKVSLRLSWLPDEAAQEVEDAAVRRGGNVGERRRKARLAHKERKSEVLMFSIPLKLVTVPDHVEKAYAMGQELARVASEATSIARSASPIGSDCSSTSSCSGPASGSSTPATSARPSPLSMTTSLPSLASSVATVCSLLRDDAAPSSLATSASHRFASMPIALPPYSELYHSNGDRKEDFSSWLPKYVEKEGVEVDSSYAANSVLGLQV